MGMEVWRYAGRGFKCWGVAFRGNVPGRHNPALLSLIVDVQCRTMVQLLPSARGWLRWAACRVLLQKELEFGRRS
jgi:hypothetical protein